jgi:pimeloyl-ACP methyl ester carboxylesterase
MQTQTGFAPINGLKFIMKWPEQDRRWFCCTPGWPTAVSGTINLPPLPSTAAPSATICAASAVRPCRPASFSQHDDLAGLLDFLQVEQAIVLGVSYGGKVAIDFALAYPQRVSGAGVGRAQHRRRSANRAHVALLGGGGNGR